MARRIAVFKLGSSTFRAMVYEVENQQGKVVHTAKAVVCPGVSYSATGLLDESVTVEGLRRLRAEAELYRPDKYVAVATGIFREARNAAQVIGALEDLLGGPVIVVTAADETAITRMAVKRYLGHDQFLLIDIGGGTTEISAPDGRFISLQAGTTSIVDSESDLAMPTPPATIERLRAKTQQLLRNYEPPAVGDGQVVGVGSTLQSLLRYRQRDPSASRGPLSMADIRLAIAELGPLSLAERIAIPGVEPERGPLMIPGAVVAEAVLAFLSVVSVEVLNAGISDGLLPWLMTMGKLND